MKRLFKRNLFLLVLLFCFFTPIHAIANKNSFIDTAYVAAKQQALAFLNQVKDLQPSSVWPNVKPDLFLKNIKRNIEDPLTIYPGNGTNFCGFGALTYLLLLDDPMGYATSLLQLYREGHVTFGKAKLYPAAAIKQAAGLLKFKGILDIHPAEQMWFLTLADHYKGYLNFFNRNYDPGDEDKFWASVNYAKFNRMVRNLLRYKVKAKGSDLIRPRVGDQYEYISNRLETGKVVLFINNRIVHKKNHSRLKLGVPTHFVVAEKISRDDNIITLVYWDYGGKTQLQLSEGFIKRIIFGITYCTKKENDAD